MEAKQEVKPHAKPLKRELKVMYVSHPSSIL